ncbi:MAG: hypothetical protein MZU95_01670 [Desulfomicrobium escambiense]|nr:hypothetical protein [Desulfomicrobium escambiense]
MTLVQAPFMAAGRDSVLTLSAASCHQARLLHRRRRFHGLRRSCSGIWRLPRSRRTRPSPHPRTAAVPGGRSKAPAGCALKGEASFEGRLSSLPGDGRSVQPLSST